MEEQDILEYQAIMQVQAITGDRDIMEEFHPGTDINHQVTLIKDTLMDINISVVDIDTSTAHTEVEAIEDMVIGTGKEAIEAVTIIDENRYRNQSQFAFNGD
ncbi:hypothetical protein [Nitrosomonas sp. Is37]|uniref:hypothetical protein n=1 Tax=Nitrosomonas sp. Is37 TaxID=3080535 RepID=UPI00294B8938|nr:hypothetical protein [Nitrosomonas sp. Is37]MDV6345239.1 hypothetical protein [Nitrosomonas sp. Is37]